MPSSFSASDLASIYDETIAELYGFVSRRCDGQRALAEDITQETWLRAVRNWNRQGLPNNPIGWLTTVARNLILNQLRRKEGVSIDLMPAAELLAAVDTNAIQDSDEVATIVSQALARIPPPEAQLLESFHYERRKMSELAATMGISERAVEGRLRRARERLRRELETTMKDHRELT